MVLETLTSAFPETSFSQEDCWKFLQDHGGSLGLRDRSLTLLQKILLGDSGIARRHFALGSPERIFSLNTQELNEAFEQEAPRLGASALRRALDQAEIRAEDLDALFVCTCTGYLCPGVSSHLAEQMGMRRDAYLQDLVGLGCGAAIPLLRSADGFLRGAPEGSRVATVCVEICSAAFYVADDPGVLISLCLFGDGASASIWSNEPRSGAWRAQGFRTVHQPEHREKIRFVNSGGRLRNQLDRSVPGLASQTAADLYADGGEHADQVLSHTGGRDVLEALEQVLPGRILGESREVLRKRGNVSSPSVLLALEDRISQRTGDQRLWAVSFGAGFSAHACDFVRLS